MVKQITRTVQVYGYILCKVSEDGSTIVDKVTLRFPYKMGTRKLENYIKENPQYEGYILTGTKVINEKYTMSLDVFLRNATMIDTDNNKEAR